MNYAYARVSAKDRTYSGRLPRLVSSALKKSRIFSEKKSGKDFERKEYKRLLKKLNCGDLLVIKSIDWLGRNYSQIIEEWNRITNIIGADILVLDILKICDFPVERFFSADINDYELDKELYTLINALPADKKEHIIAFIKK